jgi:HAD superfamily hydrolase (TIGR01490 family)
MPHAVFFDMDRTVLRVNSGTHWMRYLRRRGEISRWQFFRAVGWAVKYQLAVLDIETLSRRLVMTLRGDDEEAMRQKCRDWFAEEIVHTIAAPAREAIRAHRARGDRMALLTAATPYIAELVAGALELEGVLCSRLEVERGKFTGRIVEPLCFGHGKVELARSWATQHGLDLGTATFYTDSYNDLPMLNQVGVPVAVNPDPRLRRVASRRGWAIQTWDRVGRGGA